MVVVNQVPGAYERIRARADELAGQLGIQREVIYGFFNDHARFPTSLGELEQWGNAPTKYGVSRRDPATGAWHPIMPGTNPDPRLTPQDRGGFRHEITNAEDSDIQRFQDWHPEILNQQIAPAPARVQGGPRMGAQSMDANNYVGPTPSGVGFVSVVNGVPATFGDQAAAEQDFNARSGSGAPPAGSGAGAPGPGSAGPGASPPASTPAPTSTGSTGSGGQLTNPTVDKILLDLANNAALIAYQNKRLELDRDIASRLDEREKTRIALEAARDAAKQVQDRAEATGTYPDGTPTLKAREQAAGQTGYLPGAGVGKGQAVLTAMDAVRASPQYQALYRAGAAGDQNAVAQMRAMEAAAVQQTAGVTAEQAAQVVAQLRGMTAGAAGAQSGVGTVEAVLNQVAPGAATFEREKEQNDVAIRAMDVLSRLRGPENAFVYANTLASLPASVRQQINAAASRLPGPQNPAQRGVLGDLGLGGRQQGGPVMAMDDPITRAAQAQGVATTPTGAPMPPPGTGAMPAAAPGTLRAQVMPVMAQGVIPNAQGFTPGTPPGIMPSMTQTNPLATMPVMSQPAGAPGPGGMVAPNQLRGADVTHANPYAQKLLWAGYENQGQDPRAAEWEFMHSLPLQSGPKTARVRV